MVNIDNIVHHIEKRYFHKHFTREGCEAYFQFKAIRKSKYNTIYIHHEWAGGVVDRALVGLFEAVIREIRTYYKEEIFFFSSFFTYNID